MDSDSIVRNFMVEKLKLARGLVEDMKLERVHRIGTINQNSDNPRKIVCKFNQFTDREIVRKHKFKLENSNYYIHEQFPPEIVTKRKRLIPKLRQAKKDGKSAWISYDTLNIDGQPVKEN